MVTPKKHRDSMSRSVQSTALALGIALWFVASVSFAQEVFRHDFRGGKVSDQILKYTPSNAREMMRDEPEGLRISLPASKTNIAVGVLPKFPVKGDCEITASFELLKADMPTKGGVGVSLYFKTEPTGDAIAVSLWRLPQGLIYKYQKTTTNAEGKRPSVVRKKDTEVRAGKLRLVRKGKTVTCLVAENAGNEFIALGEFDFGVDDLSYIRVAAENGSSDVPVEVRIHDFEIRSPAVVAEVKGVEQKAEKKAWFAVVPLCIGLGMTLMLAAAFGAWLFWVQRRDKDEPTLAEEDPAE